jgi:hypothetical protein
VKTITEHDFPSKSSEGPTVGKTGEFALPDIASQQTPPPTYGEIRSRASRRMNMKLPSPRTSPPVAILCRCSLRLKLAEEFPDIALGGAWLLSGRRVLWDGLRATWPASLIGAAGICMYVLIHVEPRYVAAFLVLFFVSIMAGIGIPARFSNKLANPVILVCISLFLPIASHTYIRHSQGIGRFDADAQAAATLASLGIGRGDLVARISPVVNDLGIERIARVEVIAEVDNAHANEFWAAPESTQKELLSAFAAHGAKAVIATKPHLSQQNSSEWKQLGSTRYWVWQPPGCC